MKQMDKMQNQLSSGKKISKPSDDPVGVAYALRLRNNLVENEQYLKNVEDATSHLEATETALDEVGEVLKRIKELTVQGASGTNNAESRDAIRREVKELREHLFNVANTQFGGKYLFSGTATDTATYTDAFGNWSNRNYSSINYEVGVGVKVPINLTADMVFEDAGGSVFQSLSGLEADLTAGNGALIAGRLAEIEKWFDKGNAARAEIGARVNRLEFAKSRIENNTLNFTDLLSKTEDADMAKLITDFKVQENVYRASLASGAKIVQPTLIDFLR